MNNITVNNIGIDPNIIAKSIYSGATRESSEQGVELNTQITEELNQFLAQFTQFVGQKRNSYYRLDAYFDEQKLYILDINASFVDGWGNASNMQRSTGAELDKNSLDVFPENFYLQDEAYRPEFDLFRGELDRLGIPSLELDRLDLNYNPKTYAYGVFDKTENLFPFDGVRIDNKMNLAMFSKIWQGNSIEIPSIITPGDCSWQDAPKNFVYKVAGKNDLSNSGSWKVKVGKPKKGAWAGKQWENYKMIAQQSVETLKNDEGQNMQLIIMCANDEPLIGYVQASVSDIINDNSVQSPLILSK